MALPTTRLSKAWTAPLVLAASLACSGGKGSSPDAFTGPTPATHLYFPIVTGPHAVDCSVCHGTFPSFKQFTCLGCHALDPTTAVHPGVARFRYDSAACFGCHADPKTYPFDHKVTGTCASCHQAGAAFARLPVTSFTHPAIGALDCAACHSTSSWASVAGPPGLVADPSRAVVVDALVARFTGTSIAALSAVSETLPMPMDHASAQASGTGLACADCHPTAAAGTFFPGRFHSTLANHALPPPTGCADCHATSIPTGFVGPLATSPARHPPSGEMRHDAVAWSAGVPTATALVTLDCAACHASPSATLQATWSTDRAGGTLVRFHASLPAEAQPGSCVDCHANGRPGVLAAGAAALPTGVQLDHAAADALGDCAACHAGFAAWSGGRWHRAGDSSPARCLPCHAGERPASAAGWVAAGWSTAPFDYGTNALGATHGDGQDCALCHTGPGPGGSWGGVQTWAGGHFTHGASTVAATTCAACHQSQRPDRLLGQAVAAAALGGFDHAANGIGDCIGCHGATVAAGQYEALYGPSGTLPGGDWAGGIGYPGATLVGSPGQALTVPTVTLLRSGGGPVTGIAEGQATVPNPMLHVSAAVPAPVSAGPAAAPDWTACWHCHAHDAQGSVTSYADGVFHASLDGYSASPGGPVTPLSQPVAGCADCHASTRPPDIVEGAAGDLAPMDHGAAFAAGSTVGGRAAAGVDSLDCGACHTRTPGWRAGGFHASIGASATPADCVSCHYPLLADAASADVGSAPSFEMSHRSAQVPTQACGTCHPSALAQASSSSASAPSSQAWQPGVFHPNVPAQPAACLDCHIVSEPPAGAPTQSTVTYVLAAGGTSSNGAQWMNHGAAPVVAADCAACHADDARATGSAWSPSTPYHATVASPGRCAVCHGLENGYGSEPGAGNNMPAGLTSSSTVTSASLDPSTGVTGGTLDQITHADVNVTSYDCAFCHAQVGPSSLPGLRGSEWAQAWFHASFSASSPLVLDGATGRCSNCHLNVKPGTSFAAQDHGAFTGAPGATDCGACHSWPGTGTPAAPNWLGATDMPLFIAVGGFEIPQPPAGEPVTEPGIADLPHPTLDTGMTCASCHAGGVGGRGASGYDHASALVLASCGACHEAGSGLVGTPWNGATAGAAGAGDTRPYTLTSVVATRAGGDSCTITLPDHFYPVDCGECHATPPGTGATTTGAAYSTAWGFPHTTAAMNSPSTCNLCHLGQGCPR